MVVIQHKISSPKRKGERFTRPDHHLDHPVVYITMTFSEIFLEVLRLFTRPKTILSFIAFLSNKMPSRIKTKFNDLYYFCW